MALINEDEEYQKYSYICTELNIIFGDGVGSETLKFDAERFLSLTIDSDYVSNFFPVMKIDLVMESSTYYRILQNKDTTKIHFRIDKFYRNIDGSQKSLYREFINDTFDLILDDDDTDVYETMKDERAQLIDIGKKSDLNDLNKTCNKVEFYLYKKDFIDKMDISKGINKILIDATVQDAFSYILHTIGFEKYLLGQFENNTVYPFILIPELKARQAIRFLDTYYGTWSTGMLAFCDFDRAYIMKYGGGCTVYEQGESQETCIVIPDISDAFKVEMCSFDPNPTIKYSKSDSMKYIIGDPKTTSVRNETVSNNYINTNDVMVVDNINGDVDNLVDSNRTAQIIHKNTENKWLSSIYSMYTSGGTKVIDITLGDYDISTIKPNKKFTVYFTNSRQTDRNKGSYILSKCRHSFMKQGSEIRLTSRISLRSDLS